MTFIEWIGFVASLFGVIYLFTKDAWAKKERERDPVKYAEKERRIREVLRQMGVEPDDEEEEQPEEENENEQDEEEEEEQVVTKQTKSLPPLPSKTHTASLPAQILSRPSRVANMIKQLPDERAILVAHILFGPPKSQE